MDCAFICEWFDFSVVFPARCDNLNFQITFNVMFINTSLLSIIQHSFIQSMGFLVQPLFHTKYQGLGKFTVCPGSAAQSFVALTGKSPAQSLQVSKGGFPKNKVAVLNIHDSETLRVEVEVMIGVVVFADTASVPLAQEVAAELSGRRDIGDVRVKGGGEVGREGFT